MLQPFWECFCGKESAAQQELGECKEVGKRRNGALAFGHAADNKSKTHEDDQPEQAQDEHLDESQPAMHEREMKEELTHPNDDYGGYQLKQDAGESFAQHNIAFADRRCIVPL